VSRPRAAAAWSSVRSARQEIRIDLSDRFGKVGQFAYFDAGRIKALVLCPIQGGLRRLVVHLLGIGIHIERVRCASLGQRACQFVVLASWYQLGLGPVAIAEGVRGISTVGIQVECIPGESQRVQRVLLVLARVVDIHQSDDSARMRATP